MLSQIRSAVFCLEVVCWARSETIRALVIDPAISSIDGGHGKDDPQHHQTLYLGHTESPLAAVSPLVRNPPPRLVRAPRGVFPRRLFRVSRTLVRSPRGDSWRRATL